MTKTIALLNLYFDRHRNMVGKGTASPLGRLEVFTLKDFAAWCDEREKYRERLLASDDKK